MFGTLHLQPRRLCESPIAYVDGHYDNDSDRLKDNAKTRNVFFTRFSEPNNGQGQRKMYDVVPYALVGIRGGSGGDSGSYIDGTVRPPRRGVNRGFNANMVWGITTDNGSLTIQSTYGRDGSRGDDADNPQVAPYPPCIPAGDGRSGGNARFGTKADIYDIDNKRMISYIQSDGGRGARGSCSGDSSTETKLSYELRMYRLFL